MRELYPDYDAPLGIDLGDEFPNPFQPYTAPAGKDPLLGGATATWSSEPRPAITAWPGADIPGAYWRDGAIWRNCQTGEAWN